MCVGSCFTFTYLSLQILVRRNRLANFARVASASGSDAVLATFDPPNIFFMLVPGAGKSSHRITPLLRVCYQGCVCDDGYEGYDCSRRHCPQSDSGLTSGQQDESVVLYCRYGSADFVPL